MYNRLLFPLLLAISLGALPGLINWNIESDYAIRFEGSGAEGTFSDLEGTIEFDPNQLDRARMDVQVATATISTGNNLKNKHARGKNWLHAEKYPTISFRSQRFERSDAGYSVTGTLQMHGVERQVTIPFTFRDTPQGGLFEGSFSVDRKDFDITGPLLSFVVGNTFDISLRVPVSK